MKKVISAVYGLICYSVGMAALGYMAMWLIGLTPNALDAAPVGHLGTGVAINLGLIGLFALQHSGMARPAFKRIWTRVVPPALERSTYLLFTSFALAAVFAFWQPLGMDLWRFEQGPVYALMLTGYACGWAVLVTATFLINHFDLMGLRQVWFNLRGKPYTELPFVVRGLYRFVRHPIYFGFLLIVWMAPVMTISHLVFAGLITAYILIAVRWEERDLAAALPEYAEYQQAVPSLIPGRKTPSSEQPA